MTKKIVFKKEQKNIAKRRVGLLFAEAEKTFPLHPLLAHRQVALARKIAMKTKIRIPPELKRRFCKHCHKFLVPGANVRIRTRKGKVIISCLECRKFMRIPITKTHRSQRTP